MKNYMTHQKKPIAPCEHNKHAHFVSHCGIKLHLKCVEKVDYTTVLKIIYSIRLLELFTAYHRILPEIAVRASREDCRVPQTHEPLH